MVVGAFPAAKLGVLAIKQISKPIANVIKNSAKNSPFFRKYVCMPPAQMYNWMEVKYKMWAMNLGKPAKIPQLTEPMAIELGANLLGEFIIFTIGAGLLIVEYVRSANKEAKKEAEAKQEKLELALTISELGFRVEKQDAQIREMTRILADLDSRSFFKLIGAKDHKKEIEALPLSRLSNNSQAQVFTGNYDPSCGVVFKALNYIETEIFNDST